MLRTFEIILGILAGVLLIIVLVGMIYVIFFGRSPAVLAILREDEWVCSKSHSETKLLPVPLGKTVTLVPSISQVCDQYTRIEP